MSIDHPMIDVDKIGVAAGVREAVVKAGPLLPLRDAEQLDMLSVGSEDGRITQVMVQRAPRGRGRPKDARNKRTREVRDYLLSRYTHPLETLAQFQSSPVDLLAAQLDCTKKEAGFLIVRAAAELAPYLEGKMPVPIDLTTRGDFNLLIPGVNITVEEANQAIHGEFIPFAEFDDAEEVGTEDVGEPVE